MKRPPVSTSGAKEAATVRQRTSATVGKTWELVLEQAHDLYRRERLAVVVKANPPVKVLSKPGRGGRFSACWAGDGPPDFVGCLSGSGRAVTFDAKATDTDRWPLASLELHQAKLLEAYQPLGFSFVCLRLGRVDAFVLPWSKLGPIYWAWKDGEAVRGGASITATVAHAIGWRFSAATGDWLRAIPAEVLGG